MNKSKTLDSDARKALLSGLRKKPDSKISGPSRQSFVAPRFEEIEEYRMIKAQQDFARSVEMANPFYRVWVPGSQGQIQIGDVTVLNFGCYDYLGLNNHPEVIEAASDAAQNWGISASASRLTAGERPVHRALEAELAKIYQQDDALVFVSGHATNVSVIASLVGREDLILHDAFSHNSIVFGAVASGADRRSFPHNDLDALERMLEQLRAGARRVLIVTEGLFSMDGDSPDLSRLIEIKNRFGAWLMLDEAHSLGVLGASGAGLAEAQGVSPKGVDMIMGTLSKTLCSCGGYVTGNAALIELLRYTAPGMVYSVGLSPVLAASALAALRIMQREPDRVARLSELSRHFLSRAFDAGLELNPNADAAIQPLIVGDSLATLLLADRLRQRGIVAIPIIPPGVPENAARIRFFISYLHHEDQINWAVSCAAEELRQLTAANISLESLFASRSNPS